MQIRLNEPECAALELFRMALSEETAEDRLSAIEVMRHEVVSMGLESFPITEASSPKFVRWAATTAQPRYEAAHAFYEVAQRYEGKQERQFNIAEYIGKKVWDSIETGKFQGVPSINPNPTFTFQDTGRQEILLVVENFNGCRDTIIQELDIKPVITYHLPNAFTPNNDSKNDEFRGVGYLNGIRSFEMGIWNRWGELIFNTSNPEDGWNGRKNNNGKRAPNGVYTYIVKFTGPRGQPYEFNGLITLIR